jgi:hypothetical protein
MDRSTKEDGRRLLACRAGGLYEDGATVRGQANPDLSTGKESELAAQFCRQYDLAFG